MPAKPSPPSRKKSAAGRKGRVVRKRLADGTVKEYHYGPYRGPRRVRATDTMEALLLAYEGSQEFAALAPATQQQYTLYLRPWAKVGHLRVKAIRRSHILELRDAIAASRGRGAANVFGRVSGSLFAWAVDREWIEASPATRIRTLPGGHHRPWTDAETAAALKGLPDHLARVVRLAEVIGQRRADLCALTWAAYDGAALRLTQQKTKASLVLPLPADVRAMLDGWRREATAVTILTNSRGQPWTAPHLSREMKRATEKIGLHGLTLHGLRRRAAVRIADAGGSTHEIAAVTGHRTLSMVQLYTAGADQERLAGAAIVRLSQRATTKRKGR